MNQLYLNRMKIDGRVCVVTGGSGLLGLRHAEAIVEGGGIAVLLARNVSGLEKTRNTLLEEYGDGIRVELMSVDITDKASLEKVRDVLLEKYGHIDVLINNAANNPKVEDCSENLGATKFQDFPLEMWNMDIAVGLTGAFLCSQVFGAQMEKQGSGVILNISSDYGIISPDQRIYRRDGVQEDQQTIKPVSYPVVKHAIIGLTKYLATYWADKGIRVNTLCPASLYNGQNDEFVSKISNLVPLGRMSRPDEYVCTILYMISDAATYMTGSTVVIDGGRTIW